MMHDRWCVLTFEGTKAGLISFHRDLEAAEVHAECYISSGKYDSVFLFETKKRLNKKSESERLAEEINNSDFSQLLGRTVRMFDAKAEGNLVSLKLGIIT